MDAMAVAIHIKYLVGQNSQITFYSRMPITLVELITTSIVTIRSIWHNSADDFLRFGKFPPQICESCGASQPTDGTTKRQCVVKHTKSSNNRRKQRPSRCIIGDAILPQTGKKLTIKCGAEFGGLLWRHLTPNRKKTKIRCTTKNTIPRVHNSPKDVLENLLAK